MRGLQLKDALARVTRTLPSGAASVTSLASIGPFGKTQWGSAVALVDLLLTAPAMNTTQMPDAKTMTYDIISSDNADLSSPTVIAPGVIVQTGAGGAGCAAATARWRPSADSKAYIGLKATGSAAGDATGASATLEALF